jgi:hypothetical protein
LVGTRKGVAGPQGLVGAGVFGLVTFRTRVSMRGEPFEGASGGRKRGDPRRRVDPERGEDVALGAVSAVVCCAGRSVG